MEDIKKQGKQGIVISIDAMGGDGGPLRVSHAVAAFCRMFDDVHFRIYTTLSLEFFSSLIPSNRFTIITSETFISNDTKPTDALKNGRKSSMGMAINSVKEGLADAVISGGNTGALMVLSKMYLRCIEGIQRPAIVGKFPTSKGASIMLDLGANIDCSEQILFDFAMMGSCFAKIMLGHDFPTVALLNVGKENIKGRELEQKAHAMLSDSELNFIGYVEGHDIASGAADVIITDGFSGNLVLKASEGAATMLMKMIREAAGSSIRAKVGAFMMKKSLKQSLQRVDPSMNNGAMFAGINGIVIKSHGSATETGIVNAMKLARTLVKNKVNDAIKNELLSMHTYNHKVNILSKIKAASSLVFGHKHAPGDSEDKAGDL